MTNHITAEQARTLLAAAASGDLIPAMRVMRGGNVVVVDGVGYLLSALSAAAHELVAGTDNPGFHTPSWFYSGSPYADQIKRLGVASCNIPDDFKPEFVPDLGAVWRKGPTAWECYSKALADTEAKLAEWQASQHYRYIGRDGKPVLARDLEAQKEAAEVKLAALVEASQQMLIEYDEVDLDHPEPSSMTAAVRELRAALSEIIHD